MKPITANRYYLQDEFGEILLEVDNYIVALRVFARLTVVERKLVRLVDRIDI